MAYHIPDSATQIDSSALYSRTVRHRQQRRARLASIALPTPTISAYMAWLAAQRPQIPARMLLHGLVALLVPLAIVGEPLLKQLATPAPRVAPAALNPFDMGVPVAPLSLGVPADPRAPDSAFAEIDALQQSGFDPRLLQVQPVAATIAAETATVRTGPGTNYDAASALAQNAALTLLARHDEWYKAQQQDGSIVWITAELLTMNQTAASLLPEATDIPAPPPARVGTVATTNLNLRDGPGTNYIGMTKLDAGASLDLLARYGEWLQVQTGSGRTGWVLDQHLQLEPGVIERVEVVSSIPEANPQMVGSVSAGGVNLRGGPGTAYGRLVLLDAGTQLDLLGRANDWYKVRTPRGMVGWVSAELMRLDDFIARRVPATRDIPALPQQQAAPRAAVQAQPAAIQQAAPPAAVQPPPAPSAAGSNAVGFAMQHVGYRYVWGGEGPGGFDCSGFTRYVYRQYGLNLPHSAAGQFNTAYGAIVSNAGDLQPGDLVFFANTYTRGISHVGIYVGGGNVVQALSPGQGVGVANISGGYWAAHYYAGLRPRT